MGVTKNPYVYALWAVVLVVVGVLVFTGRLEWTIGAGFLIALGLPSVLSVAPKEKKP